MAELPPPPEGFEMVGGAIPPPPPGFEIATFADRFGVPADAQYPPVRPPAGFKPLYPEGEITVGKVLQMAGTDIKNAVVGILHTPEEAFEASERTRVGEGTSDDAGAIMAGAMLGGVKLGRGGNIPGKMQAPAGEPVGRPSVVPLPAPPPAAGAPTKVTVNALPERGGLVPEPPPGFEPVARDLGAAASGTKAEPLPVTKPEITAVADDLNRLAKSAVADRAEISNRMEATPPEFKTPALQEKFYHAIENPAEYNKLTPQERLLFEQHVQPMRDELTALYNKVKQYGGEDMVADPTYVHRIAKGHAPAYDSLEGASGDPVQGTRSLRRSTSALQGRKFFALEDQNGGRFVVSKGDGQTIVWNNGKGTPMTAEIELRPGTEVSLGGKVFDIKQARTPEIEANTDVRYYKNAAVNTADALVRMREVARNIEALEKFKTDLTASGRAAPMRGGHAPEGFVETKVPQLRGTAFEPKIAAAFDDFYKPGLEGLDGLRKINQFATGSIFWNPIPHIENVAAHWFTGRGWDWIRPGPMRNFSTDAGRAIREVVTQGPEYQRLLREGNGLVYGGVKNGDFYQAMAKRFGMEVEQNWSAWKPAFDKLGLRTPYEATAWWYGKMRNVLWAANDMFMLHRVFELERKGMGVREAIKEAERHIPNYRIPSEVLGSRQFARILQEPALTIFSRYHYGQWKSYMNMVGDMAKGAPKEKVEALGNVAALGVLMYGIYSAVDVALQLATGDKDAKKLRRGSTSIPDWAMEMYHGDLTLPQFLSNAITMAPATKEGMQQFTGKDWFTGQDLGNAPNRAEHAAKAIVSPYNVATQMGDDRPGTRSAGRVMFDQLAGAKNTSERTTQGRERAKAFREKGDERQFHRPTGYISKSYKAIREYLGP